MRQRIPIRTTAAGFANFMLNYTIERDIKLFLEQKLDVNRQGWYEDFIIRYFRS